MVMNIEIYLDGADTAKMIELMPRCAGATTNPSLCRKAGITDYREFARQVLEIIPQKPVSFEVFGDDIKEMQRQAWEIASWGDNVFVKIPIVNTKGESTATLIEELSDIQLNVTAILTKEQIKAAVRALDGAPGIVSIFAGRIADAGNDPVKSVAYAVNLTRSGKTKVLWASVREVYNVIQADDIGCDIITCSPEMVAKLSGIGRDLKEVSIETIKQFHRDGEGFTI